ncbi:MAG TPA: SDR family NAD(P)-dependent oxidoreductase [Bordetella sp.]
MKRVFITGAGSGLGLALAKRYAADGATLGLVGRSERTLRELAASLPGQHGCYALDVRDREALHAAARDFIARNAGHADVVIASAGISAGTVTGELDDYAVFRAIVETNLQATWPPSSLWQMGIAAKLMRLLPDGLYDRLARNAPRKPRRNGP